MCTQRWSLKFRRLTATSGSTAAVVDGRAGGCWPARAGRAPLPHGRVLEWRTVLAGVAMNRPSIHRWGLTAASALAPFLLIGGVPAAAAAARTTFTVSATVTARVVIARASVPAELEISARDIERGYIELPRAARLLVNSNSPDGFTLELWPVNSVFSAVTVRANGAVATFASDGGEIVERGLRGTAVPLRLDFRFDLSPGTVPGRYPWPLQFSVRPLAGIQ